MDSITQVTFLIDLAVRNWPTVCPRRRARAIRLVELGKVESVNCLTGSVECSNGGGRYQILDGRCMCPDAVRTGQPCKHSMAVTMLRCWQLWSRRRIRHTAAIIVPSVIRDAASAA